MRRACRFDAVLACLSALLLSGGLAATAQARSAAKAPASAIQIQQVECEEVKLPPEFQMALYENLIAAVRKTGKFQRVYRDGERGAKDASALVILHSTVRGFKEGSARARQVTTVAGATSIKMHERFVAPDGRVLLERDVVGKVRFLGENLRATYDFGKKVAWIAAENF